jgi:hypothetical protein
MGRVRFFRGVGFGGGRKCFSHEGVKVCGFDMQLVRLLLFTPDRHLYSSHRFATIGELAMLGLPNP